MFYLKGERMAKIDQIKTWPETIYLQVSDDGESVPSFSECSLEDVTWCSDSVVTTEVKYIRADLIRRKIKP